MRPNIDERFSGCQECQKIPSSGDKVKVTIMFQGGRLLIPNWVSAMHQISRRAVGYFLGKHQKLRKKYGIYTGA